jgi:predicted GNAT superfamily acetyltransferase
MPITYRICKTSAEFEAISALEILVWNMSDRQSISPDVLHVLGHTGGSVLGAFDEEKLVAFTIAFATRDKEQLWSHIAAVHPEYQSHGIGYEIKHKQREWAIEQGFERISWTFDPLQRGNAYFNFHLLGTVCQKYHENFYGEMRDGLNVGLPTDRFEVVWNLLQAERYPLPEDAPFLLEALDTAPQLRGQATEEWHLLEIPYDINSLKSQNMALALEWRLAMREVLGAAFKENYCVVDFSKDSEKQRAYYWLKRL